MRARRAISAVLLGGAAACLAQAPVSAAEPAPTAVIVFDGSGSMWGRLEPDKVAKFTAARDGVRDALSKLKPPAKAGLVSFGHRRRGDCSDVEVMVEPGRLDADTINAQIEVLNPKGKGPLVAAVAEAAKVASASGRPASVVLIHDDLDNCLQDSCRAGTDIAKLYPGVAVHVVSVGLRREDHPRMSCLAQATGGKFFDAQTSQATVASIDTALNLALPSAPPAPVAAPRPGERGPSAAARTDGPPGLELIATLGDTATPIDAPVRWRVARKSSDPSDKPLDASGATAQLPVEPGTYDVEVRSGLVAFNQPVEVAAKGATVVRAPLSAGVIQLTASLSKDGPVLPRAMLTVAEVTASGQAGKTLWIGQDAGARVVLPAGPYRVVAQDGLARVERTIVVPAGTRSDLELTLTAGRLKLQASNAEGSAALDNVWFQILEDDPASPQGRREVARSAASRPSFTLPSGTYHAVVRDGGVEARERVVVRPGEDVSRTLVLSTGRVTLGANVKGSLSTLSDGVSYRVERLDGEAREISRHLGAQPTLELPAGRYRVSMQVGSQNARSAREIVVKAATDQKVLMEVSASDVRLKLSDGAASLAGAEAFWEVRDEAGSAVWRTFQLEPRAYLAPGRYRVRVGARGGRFEKTIDVRPVEAQTIVIGPE